MTTRVTTLEYAVDPDRMLAVNYVDRSGKEREVAAITCAYAPVRTHQGAVQVAVQIVWDPASQNPASPYYCPAERVERILLPPAKLRRVRPFRTR